MRRERAIAAAVLLVVVVLFSVFVAVLWNKPTFPAPDFFVGVEVAYVKANATDVKVMVDKVKDYTNLIVVGAPEISLNESALNETMNYITAAGLNFIILFTDSRMYTPPTFPFEWASEAKQKYGDKFLGVYRYDEPGGNQIDQGHETLVDNATSYGDAAGQFTTGLGIIVDFNLDFAPQVFTADYALQWFDYKSNYSAVFTEFGSNNTREIAVAADRGAASSFGRDWGAIITWEYNVEPYIESDSALYTDLVNAYRVGAKYVIVFDSPKLSTYGILTENHFGKLKQFWNYVQDNPQDFGSQKATAAYVMPKDYGFGLRRVDDRIWGLFPADELSPKIWSDTNKLVQRYGFGFDIIFDEVGVVDAARNRYENVFFWNETLSVS